MPGVTAVAKKNLSSKTAQRRFFGWFLVWGSVAENKTKTRQTGSVARLRPRQFCRGCKGDAGDQRKSFGPLAGKPRINPAEREDGQGSAGRWRAFFAATKVIAQL